MFVPRFVRYRPSRPEARKHSMRVSGQANADQTVRLRSWFGHQVQQLVVKPRGDAATFDASRQC